MDSDMVYQVSFISSSIDSDTRWYLHPNPFTKSVGHLIEEKMPVWLYLKVTAAVCEEYPAELCQKIRRQRDTVNRHKLNKSYNTARIYNRLGRARDRVGSSRATE